MSVLTTRGTTPPLSPIAGSSIEQRGYKKVHWKERGHNTLVESSRLVLVMCVLSLEMEINGTHVTFTRSDNYDPSRHPRPLLQSSRVSLLTDRTRSGTYWVRATWRVTVKGKSSVNKFAGSQQCTRVELRHQQAWQNKLQTPQRSTGHRRSPCPLNRDSCCEQPNQINVY